jgi:hypothetical protein
MDKRYTYKPISSVKLMSKMYSVNNNVEVRNNNNIRCLRDGPRKYRVTWPEKNFWFLI